MKRSKYRSLDRVLHSTEFDKLWETLNRKEKLDLINVIKTTTKDRVIKYIKGLLVTKKINEKTLQALKKEASNLKITGYSQMTKQELITLLKEDNSG